MCGCSRAPKSACQMLTKVYSLRIAVSISPFGKCLELDLKTSHEDASHWTIRIWQGIWVLTPHCSLPGIGIVQEYSLSERVFTLFSPPLAIPLINSERNSVEGRKGTAFNSRLIKWLPIASKADII